jgi:hypothetical protein
MSYKTLEVELENGVVHASGSETLPVKAHALLTILDVTASEPLASPEPSLADLAQDFFGIGNGTHSDLSTNRRHMADFGR